MKAKKPKAYILNRLRILHNWNDIAWSNNGVLLRQISPVGDWYPVTKEQIKQAESFTAEEWNYIVGGRVGGQL